MRTWAFIQVSIDIMAARNIIQLDWRQIADDVVFHELVNSVLDALFPSYVPGRTKRISDGGWDGGLFTLPLNKLAAGKGKDSVMVQAKFTEKTGTPAKKHLQSELMGTSRKPGEIAKAVHHGAKVLLLLTSAELGVKEVRALEALAPLGLTIRVWARAKLELKIRKEPLIVSRFFGVPGVPGLVPARETLTRRGVLSLVTREPEVQAIATSLGDHARAVVVHAPGGTGKSEMLRQVVECLAQSRRVACVVPDVQPATELVQQLPALGDVVLVIDDVDRVLEYLQPVFRAVLTHKGCERVRLLLACRSAGLGAVMRALSQFDSAPTVVEHQVPPLDDATLRAVLLASGLREHQVGPAIQSTRGNLFLLSEYVSALQKGNVAGSLGKLREFVATKLELDFRALEGTLGFTASHSLDFLSAVALVAPFDARSDGVQRFIQTVSGVSTDNCMRLLAGMGAVGITRTVGSRTRMSADMLSDLLLAERLERVDGSHLLSRVLQCAFDAGIEEVVLANIEGATWCGSTRAAAALEAWLKERQGRLADASVAEIERWLQFASRLAASAGPDALAFLVDATSELAARQSSADKSDVLSMDSVAPILVAAGGRPDCAGEIIKALCDIGHWLGPGRNTDSAPRRVAATLSNPMIQPKAVIDRIIESSEALLSDSDFNVNSLDFFRGVLTTNLDVSHELRSFHGMQITHTTFTYNDFDERIRARRARVVELLHRAITHDDERVRHAALEVVDDLPRYPAGERRAGSVAAFVVGERGTVLRWLCDRLAVEPSIGLRHRLRALLAEEWLDQGAESEQVARPLRTTPPPIDELMMICCGIYGWQPLNFARVEALAPVESRRRLILDPDYALLTESLGRIHAAFPRPGDLAEALQRVNDAGAKDPHLLGRLFRFYVDQHPDFLSKLVREHGANLPRWATMMADAVEVSRDSKRARRHMKYLRSQPRPTYDAVRVHEATKTFVRTHRLSAATWRLLTAAAKCTTPEVRQRVLEWARWERQCFTVEARATLFAIAMRVAFDESVASRLRSALTALSAGDSARMRPLLRDALFSANVVGHTFESSDICHVARWVLGDSVDEYLTFLRKLAHVAISWEVLESGTPFYAALYTLPSVDDESAVREVLGVLLALRDHFQLSDYDFEKLVSEVRARFSTRARVDLCRSLLRSLNGRGAGAAALALVGVEPSVGVAEWPRILEAATGDVEAFLIRGLLYDDVGPGFWSTDFFGPFAAKAGTLRRIKTKASDANVRRILNRAIVVADEQAKAVDAERLALYDQ